MTENPAIPTHKPEVSPEKIAEASEELVKVITARSGNFNSVKLRLKKAARKKSLAAAEEVLVAAKRS